MSKWKEQQRARARERVFIQDEIKRLLKAKSLEKARQRLCARCSVGECLLLPLCLDGNDCPYFK